MADEEKAKELTTELICGKCTEIKHCKIIGTDKCVTYIRSLNAISQGYNKGYEDGKPKWHNLIKDPNDLPKECQNVLCLCNDIGYKYCCTGHLIYKTWLSNIVSKKLRVIAWCELPKFEEN